MSFPINAATILAATQAARSVASTVAAELTEAAGFDQVLRDATPVGSAGELIEKTAQAIEEKLRRFGIDVNRPLNLAVKNDGVVEVVSQHERAAEIESKLAADGELSRLTDQLFRIAGPVRLTNGSG